MKKNIASLMRSDHTWRLARFIINGIVCTGIYYVIYLLMLERNSVSVAFTVGYGLSFIVNFFLTSFFTFRRKPSTRRFVGFCGSHLVNYVVQIILLHAFIFLGVGKSIAPLPAMAIAAMVQYTILNKVFKK